MTHEHNRRDTDVRINSIEARLVLLHDAQQSNITAVNELKDLLITFIHGSKTKFEDHDTKINAMWMVYQKGEWPARAFFWVVVTCGAVVLASACKKLMSLLSGNG